MVLGGPLFATLLLRAAGTAFRGTFAASVSVLALLLSVAVIVLQSNELATLHSSVQQASALLPDYGAWQVGRIILVAAGLGCWLCPLIRRRAENPRALCRPVLVVVGELIGRGLFYGLHMTVGMAIAG